MAGERGLLMPEIRTAVRTGDTLMHERRAMLKRPPHILVTTPESLYILLTAERSRAILRDVETVIVDEIHAVADDKRGAHLALSLERLEALTHRPPGAHRAFGNPEADRRSRALPDRQRPAGAGDRGYRAQAQARSRGGSSRAAHWGRSPPTKCGTRFTTGWWNWLSSIAPRWCSSTRGGWRSGLRITWANGWAKKTLPRIMAACRASCAWPRKQKLKEGKVKVLVATASLELGIDIGTVDLVVQISSPRAIAVALQRVGRSGHWRGAVPKGRFFAGTRDDLLECAALVRAIRQGDLDRLIIPDAPLDILAQQIVATCAAESSAVWSGRPARTAVSEVGIQTLAIDRQACLALTAGGTPALHEIRATADGTKMNYLPWSRAPIPIAIFPARLTTRFSKCFPRGLLRAADAMALTSITIE